MHVIHIGKILSNISIVAMLFVLISFLSITVSAPALICYYVLLCFSVVLSFGTVLLTDTFANLWTGGVNAISKFSEILQVIWPYALAITAICAISSLICLCFEKYNKSKGRIAFSITIIAITIIMLILFVIGGKAWIN